MIKKIAAIIAAAACAGVMVTLVPGLAPEVAAGASQPSNQNLTTVARANEPAEVAAPNAAEIRRAAEQSVGSSGGDGKIVCAQAWPYYERGCLRGDRKALGNPHAVRVIALDRSSAMAARH